MSGKKVMKTQIKMMPLRHTMVFVKQIGKLVLPTNYLPSIILFPVKAHCFTHFMGMSL